MISRRTFLAAAAATPAAAFAVQSRPAEQMIDRPIPKSGERVPVIGLGTWQTFDPPQVDDQSLSPLRDVLHAFHARGGRVVDSSPMYGKSESVLGRLSTEMRVNGDLFIATKVWTRGRDEGERQMRQSMTELRREKVELMQVHNLVDWRTHLVTLRQWKDSGRFRYIGVTHYQPSAFDELERILRAEQVDFVQLPYSIAMRAAEERLLPAARDTGTAVLVNRPFEGGGLFAKVRDKPLPDFARRFASSWAQAFLKYLVAHDAVTCVIPATSNPKHLADDIEAGFGELPDEAERQRLIAAVA